MHDFSDAEKQKLLEYTGAVPKKGAMKAFCEKLDELRQKHGDREAKTRRNSKHYKAWRARMVKTSRVLGGPEPQAVHLNRRAAIAMQFVWR